jgi:hypothetical protein
MTDLTGFQAIGRGLQGSMTLRCGCVVAGRAGGDNWQSRADNFVTLGDDSGLDAARQGQRVATLDVASFASRPISGEDYI